MAGGVDGYERGYGDMDERIARSVVRIPAKREAMEKCIRNARIMSVLAGMPTGVLAYLGFRALGLL